MNLPSIIQQQGTSYKMRDPCRYCHFPSMDGSLVPTNGQNCVYCAACGKLAYNAPKTETGEAPLPTVPRGDISPRQRARILQRDLARCVLCGRGPEQSVVLHIDHLLSLKDGAEAGIPIAELSRDENLATFCDACNLGKGDNSVSPRLMARLLSIRR